MMARIFTIIGSVFFAVGLGLVIGLGYMANYLFNSPSSGNDFYQNHLVLLFPGIGMIFLALGTIFLIIALFKRRFRKWLLENGKPIWAQVQGTSVDWRVQVNGRPMTVLVANHGTMRFESEPVNNRLLANIGENTHVKVLLHPDNPDRYAFDFNNESPLCPAESPKLQ